MISGLCPHVHRLIPQVMILYHYIMKIIITQVQHKLYLRKIIPKKLNTNKSLIMRHKINKISI